MTIFTTDLGLPEAPLLLADGSWLVAELAFERGRITKVSADGSTHETIAETGRPNGLALGRDGIVWACETLTPSLLAHAAVRRLRRRADRGRRACRCCGRTTSASGPTARST